MKRKRVARRRGMRLAPGCRLSSGVGRSARVLICPAGAVQLNELAAVILALCDGRLTREQIVARVVAASRRGLALDVRAFLTAARRRGWLVDASAARAVDRAGRRQGGPCRS